VIKNVMKTASLLSTDKERSLRVEDIQAVFQLRGVSTSSKKDFDVIPPKTISDLSQDLAPEMPYN